MGSMHVLRYVRIPQFARHESAHQKLVELSKAAHKSTKQGEVEKLREIEQEVDAWAAKLWSLSKDELAEVRHSLEEMQ